MTVITDSFTIVGEKMNLYKKLREELKELTSPMLHACTQSGRSIVAVYDFYAETIDENMHVISAEHNGNRNWQILGVYRTKERTLQIYEEMLQHSKTNPVEIYQMPQE